MPVQGGRYLLGPASTCKLVPPSTVPRLGAGQKIGEAPFNPVLYPTLACGSDWQHVRVGGMVRHPDTAVVLMGPWITRARQAQVCQMHHLGNCKRMDSCGQRLTSGRSASVHTAPVLDEGK